MSICAQGGRREAWHPRDMAYRTDPHTYVSTSAGTPGGSPRTVATLTVLGWNLLPLAAIAIVVLSAMAQAEQTDGWSSLAAAAVGVIGGGALVASVIVGLVIARLHVKHSVTAGRTPHGFGIGTLAAILGWLITVGLGVAVYPALNNTPWF